MKNAMDLERAEYETALGRFEEFVGAVIMEISRFDDLGGVSPKECMFRIFRDVRFSKDQSPYKTAMGASIGPGGRKSMGLGITRCSAVAGTTRLRNSSRHGETQWTRMLPRSRKLSEVRLSWPHSADWQGRSWPGFRGAIPLTTPSSISSA
jgi:hypothetical protein